MTDSRGLSTKGWWINHADKVLDELECRETWVEGITDDDEQSVFRIRQNITITKVYHVPDEAYAPGAIYLVNRGTAGAVDSTVASHTAHSTLTALAVQELTVDSDYSAIDAGEVLTFKRTTASGDTVQKAGLVGIEYTIRNTGA